MIRIGYAPGAYDLFHIGHLNLLRRAREHCEYLIVGVVADEVLIRHKGVTPVIPLSERVEIVRNVRWPQSRARGLSGSPTPAKEDTRHVSVGSGRACPKPPFMGFSEQYPRD